MFYFPYILLLFSHSVDLTNSWDPMDCSTQISLFFTLSWSLLKFMSIELVVLSNHLKFFFCLQSFPAPESFLMSWLFTSGDQSIWASALVSVLPMSIQGRFPLGFTRLISLLSKRLSRVFSSTTVQKHQFLSTQPSLWSNSHILTWLLWKP